MGNIGPIANFDVKKGNLLFMMGYSDVKEGNLLFMMGYSELKLTFSTLDEWAVVGK